MCKKSSSFSGLEVHISQNRTKKAVCIFFIWVKFTTAWLMTLALEIYVWRCLKVTNTTEKLNFAALQMII